MDPEAADEDAQQARGETRLRLGVVRRVVAGLAVRAGLTVGARLRVARLLAVSLLGVARLRRGAVALVGRLLAVAGGARRPVRLLAVRVTGRWLLVVARRRAPRRGGAGGGRGGGGAVPLRRVGLLLVRVLGQGGSSGGAPLVGAGLVVVRAVLASPASSAMIGSRAGSPRILPEGPGRTPSAPRGCSSMVELQLPKLIARVRFPSPAQPARAPHRSGAALSSSWAPRPPRGDAAQPRAAGGPSRPGTGADRPRGRRHARRRACGRATGRSRRTRNPHQEDHS